MIYSFEVNKSEKRIVVLTNFPSDLTPNTKTSQVLQLILLSLDSIWTLIRTHSLFVASRSQITRSSLFRWRPQMCATTWKIDTVTVYWLQLSASHTLLETKYEIQTWQTKRDTDLIGHRHNPTEETWLGTHCVQWLNGSSHWSVVYAV